MTAAAGLLLIDEIVPRIQAAVPKCVKKIGAEDDSELIQDGVAQAAMAIESCEARGQPLFASSIAYFAVQRLKSGRRSNYAGRADALSPASQLDGNSVVSSMDAPIPGDDEGDQYSMHDVLGNIEEDPSQQAARVLDWEALMADLDDRKVAILRATAEGGKLDALARKFHVSAPRITQLKHELAKQIKLRWGDSALADAVHAPAWAASINAGREQSRCRHERAALAAG